MKNLLLFTIIILAACDSGNHDYVTPPDQNVVFDKKITASTPRVCNHPILFTVAFPAEFDHCKRWYFDYGNSSQAVTGSKETFYVYKHPGNYTIRVEGWNHDNSKMLLSNALKIQVQ